MYWELDWRVGSQRHVWEMQIGKASERYCGTAIWLYQYLLIFSSLKNHKIVCEAQRLTFVCMKKKPKHTEDFPIWIFSYIF